MSRVRAIARHLRLAPMTTGARHGLTYLTVLVILVIGGAYYLSARSVNELRGEQRKLEAEIRADCKQDADLGGAPVVAPKGLKPSMLGVKIVSDFRVAWRGHDCPGRQPAPDPTFVRWAKAYHLPYK